MNAPLPPLGWGGVVRIGLVQTALGAISLVVTSTMNRVMVVELALPAVLPGLLVAIHYAVQLMRPRMGHGSDTGGRRTPWIIGGMAVLATGGIISALATALMATNTAAGIALALLGFTLVGLGIGASGTALLALLAARVAPTRRPAGATIVWLMMIAGFALTAIAISQALDPYSHGRLVLVTAAVCGAALLVTILAIQGIEGNAAPVVEAAAPQAKPEFGAVLREVWAETQARRFAIFVFLSMFAYSAQDLVLEPFGGLVFAMTPGETAALSGMLHAGVFAGMVLVAILGSRFGGGRVEALRGWAVGGCAASAVASLGIVTAALAGGAVPLSPTVFLLGLANGTFVTAAIGSMMGLAGAGQKSREGIRMGLWGAAQAIAFGLGGLVGTIATDLARLAAETPGSAYAMVFLLQSALFLLAARQAVLVFRQPGASAPSIPQGGLPAAIERG